MKTRRSTTAAAMLAAAFMSGLTVAPGAQGQRMALADRVEALERQLAADADDEQRATLADLVYRLNDLQREVRELRGLIEQQGFEIENLRNSQRDQYLDLDRRLGALAAGEASSDPGYAPADDPDRPYVIDAAERPVRVPAERPGRQPVPAAATELPEVREAIDARLETRPLDDPDSGDIVAKVDPVAEKEAYDAAFEALKAGRYADASRQFDAFVRRYPDSEYADNAQYWLGESYYVTRNYRVALDAFEDLLARFPDSAKAPDAQLKIGLSQYSLQNWIEAERALETVLARYPDTTVARLAQNRLRTMRIEGYID